MGRWAEVVRGDGGAASAPLACLVVQVLAPRALDLGAGRDFGHGDLPPGAAVGRGAAGGGVYHQHPAAGGGPPPQDFSARVPPTPPPPPPRPPPTGTAGGEDG